MDLVIEKTINLLSNITISELGDLATFGLLLFTIWQFRVISRRQYFQKEMEQAKSISAWIGPMTGDVTTKFTVSNKSESPVYEVVASLVSVQGAAYSSGLETPLESRAFLSILPPGCQQIGWNILIDGGMGLHFGVEIAFTDCCGINWVRKCDGSLIKISDKAVEYYGLSRPLIWEYPAI